MKRRTIRSLCFGALVCLSVSALAANLLPESVQKKVNSIQVAIDPRVELISVVQYLSEFRDSEEPLIIKDDFAYRREVDAYFVPYKQHAALRMIADMSKAGCSHSWPSLSMLYLDENLRPRTGLRTNPMLLERCGGAGQLQKLATELRTFNAESHFSAFFEKHRSFYAGAVENFAINLDRDYISELEDFYGVHYRSYSMLLVPLYGPVGYGPIIEGSKGEKYVYAILGTHSLKDDQVFFGSKSYLTYMQRHEFSHSFVNPLATRYADSVAKSSRLISLMKVAQQKGVCGDWEECLNESVVRGVTTYLACQDNPESGKKVLDKEVSRGAVLTPDILTALREYAAERKKYPTFADYYPVLLSKLANLQVQ